jgi:hypothetical protein
MKAVFLVFLWVVSKLGQIVGVAQLFTSLFGSIGYLIAMVALGGVLRLSASGLLLVLALVAGLILHWDWWWFPVILIGEFEGPGALKKALR